MITDTIIVRVAEVGRIIRALERGIVGSFDTVMALRGCYERGLITSEEFVVVIEENELGEALEEVCGEIERGMEQEDEV